MGNRGNRGMFGMDWDGDGKVSREDDLFTMMAMEEDERGGGHGGCYVATCVYGSYDCPPVWTLRRFRDEHLAKSAPGRAFIRLYYALSPTAVKWFGGTAWFRRFFRARLDTLVARLRAEGYGDTPYRDRM